MHSGTLHDSSSDESRRWTSLTQVFIAVRLQSKYLIGTVAVDKLPALEELVCYVTCLIWMRVFHVVQTVLGLELNRCQWLS